MSSVPVYVSPPSPRRVEQLREATPIQWKAVYRNIREQIRAAPTDEHDMSVVMVNFNQYTSRDLINYLVSTTVKLYSECEYIMATDCGNGMVRLATDKTHPQWDTSPRGSSRGGND